MLLSIPPLRNLLPIPYHRLYYIYAEAHPPPVVVGADLSVGALCVVNCAIPPSSGLTIITYQVAAIDINLDRPNLTYQETHMHHSKSSDYDYCVHPSVADSIRQKAPNELSRHGYSINAKNKFNILVQ